MSNVTMKIDNDCEMLEIYVGEKCLFMGNFWDFSTPSDLQKLMKALGHEVQVENYSFE